ncbi:MAG: DUF4920 domain-containing protein [Myxococcota bacterium]|nr:DUF4920 domain-containing protein [Myxococcota bacterium]
MRAALTALVLIACGADDAAGTPTPAQAPTPAETPAVEAAPATADAGTVAAAAADWKTYGDAFTLSTDKTLACGDLLANPAGHVDTTVRVSGRVADVCQKMGCWMVITPEDTTDPKAMIRVTMKDHAFSVDKQGAGNIAQLEGILKAVEIDEETVEHYASESGAEGAVPEKQGMKYELVASAVQMKPATGPK